jgi:hypothetical protein
MISFALILMTLPSRMAEVRAGRANRAGWADRAHRGESDSGRTGLVVPSIRRERLGGGGVDNGYIKAPQSGPLSAEGYGSAHASLHGNPAEKEP